MYQNRPQSLILYLSSMLASRKIFEMIKNKNIKPRNNIKKAAFYYYLISNSFGANISQFVISKIREPKRLVKDFNECSKGFKNASIKNKDYEYILKQYDNKDALFYLDPPYVRAEDYYQNTGGFSINEHERLCELLKNIKDYSLINELYKDFNIKQTSVSYSLMLEKKAKG